MIQIRTRFKEKAETTGRELRGVVEHVGSGRRQPFVDTRELLAFLRADHQGLPTEVER